MVLLARRGAAALLAPLISSLMTPMHPLHADTVVPTAKHVVTNRCRLSINIGNGEQRELILALFGEEAPASVALFEQLCDGSLGFGSYRGSIATRVEPNKQIVLGRCVSKLTRRPSKQLVCNWSATGAIADVVPLSVCEALTR